MRKDRIISLALALLFFLAGFAKALSQGRKDALNALLVLPAVLLLPLALIWFGDALGEYTGPVSRGYIDQKSPGCLVKFFGWVFLLAVIGFLSVFLVFSEHPPAR
jgi:hypothetical protein